MSNIIRVPRDGQGAAPPQSRNAAALEKEMLDAAEQEAQRLLVATREQIRDVLTKARQDLLVLRSQIEAGHAHVRGADTYSRHLVREVAGSIRPEIQALDREIAATQQTLLEYRQEIGEAPLLAEAETAEPVADTAASGPSRRGFVAAAVAVLLIATVGIAALRWRTRPPTDAPRVTAPARAASRATPVRPANARVTPKAQAARGSSQLVLEARQPVWVRVRADGTADAGHTLAAGERRAISGSRISIRAGNAGALAVSVNGGAFEVFGREGQPLTRDFGEAPPAPPRRSEDATPPATAANHPAATVPATVATKVAAATSTPSIAPKVAAATPPPSAVTQRVVVPSPAPTAAPGPVTRPATALAAKSSSPTAAQSAGPAQATPPPAAAAPEVEIVRSAEAWLMAFFNRDQPGMTRIGGSATVVDDQRTATDRPPAGIVVRRSLEQVRVQLVNSSALYTARLIETPQDGGTPLVSLISQVWLRSGSTWQMLSVRVMPESKVRATLH